MTLNIKENIERLKEKVYKISDRYGIKYPINIVAVSKTHPVEKIIEAYNSGLKIFGENKVQEGVKKIKKLKEQGYKDIKWYMIGHLQTNKVKYVVKNFEMIQSIDREKLVDILVKELGKINTKINILIEVNTSLEVQKSGVSPDNYYKLLEYILNRGKEFLNLKGLMTIGPLTDNKNKIAKSFKLLKKLFDETKEKYKEVDFEFLSMGMSGDFEIAIAEGSNMIRVGTYIFGRREY